MTMLFIVMGAVTWNSMRRVGSVPSGPMLLFFPFLVAMIVFNIAILMWFRRRLITDFTWDGRALRFRTLGSDQEQIRDISEFSWLRESYGRGGKTGYRMRFRDGQKIYLDLMTPNSVAVAEQIRARLNAAEFR